MMKQINVYGSGCKNCVTTAERLEQVTKVTDLEAIMTAGMMSTPAVGVDGVLKHSGSVPTGEQVKKMLE